MGAVGLGSPSARIHCRTAGSRNGLGGVGIGFTQAAKVEEDILFLREKVALLILRGQNYAPDLLVSMMKPSYHLEKDMLCKKLRNMKQLN